MTDAGAVLGEDGRLKFPRKLVEKMLSLACKDFSLHGRSAEHDLLLKRIGFIMVLQGQQYTLLI